MGLLMERVGPTKCSFALDENLRHHDENLSTRIDWRHVSIIDFSVHPHYIATQRSASDTSRLSDKDRILDVFDDLLWIYTFFIKPCN